MDTPKKMCSVHADVELVARNTRFGLRFSCPEKDCDVACWDGPTSTPADEATRKLRREAHAAFDRLWKGRRAAWRDWLYRKLAVELGIDRDSCHIGMFDKDVCKRTIKLANSWEHDMRHGRKYMGKGEGSN